MKTVFTLILFITFMFTSQIGAAQSQSGKMAGKGAGTGALIGAIAGAILGDDDIIGSAAEGALIGGGIGALTGAIEGGKLDRQSKKQFDALIQEFGEENLKGYIELMQCNYEKALALFKVGEVSNIENHQLAGIWLQAIAEKDRKNPDQAKAIYAKIVETDNDIDDMQQAGLAIDNYVLVLREDRRANKLSTCN